MIEALRASPCLSSNCAVAPCRAPPPHLLAASITPPSHQPSLGRAPLDLPNNPAALLASRSPHRSPLCRTLSRSRPSTPLPTPSRPALLPHALRAPLSALSCVCVLRCANPARWITTYTRRLRRSSRPLSLALLSLSLLSSLLSLSLCLSLARSLSVLRSSFSLCVVVFGNDRR